MLSALAFVLVNANPTPLVAYTARFYYQDSRHSYGQVYLADFHGRWKKQLTHGKGDRFNIRWLTHTRLCWFETNKVLGPGDDWNAPVTIVEYDLQSRQRKIVARGRYERDYQVIRPGNVAYKRYIIKDKGTFSETMDYPKTYDGFVERNGHLVRTHTEPPEDPYSNVSDGGDPDYPTDSTDILVRAKPQSLVPAGVHTVLFPSSNPNRCWVQNGFYASSAGSEEWLYQVDLVKRTSKRVVSNYLEIDFGGDNGLWVSLTPSKVTRQMGKIRIWATDVRAGDIRTGKEWYLAKGFVDASSVSLQPLK